MNKLQQNIILPEARTNNVPLPELLSLIPAGFPSPADDYMAGTLDLNDYLIRNKATSFYVRVAGDSMRNAGIMPGDLLLADRSVDAGHNRIVVAMINGEMAVKRLWLGENKIFLVSENPEFKPIEITDEMDAHVWGVVVAVIRKLA